MANNYAYVGHMFFAGPRQGWSETLQLLAGSYAEGALIMAGAIALRTWLLASDCKIISARIRKLGRPRDSKNVKQTYPILGGAGAITTPPTVDTTLPENDAILVRFDATEGTSAPDESGKFANYWIHGLPKTVVTGSGLVDNAGAPLVVTTLPFVTVAAAGTPATWGAALNNYLKFVGGSTVHRTDNRIFPLYLNPGQAVSVTDLPWDDAEVTGVRTHKTGGFFTTSRGHR